MALTNIMDEHNKKRMYYLVSIVMSFTWRRSYCEAINVALLAPSSTTEVPLNMSSSVAMLLAAINDINNDPYLLPGHQLNVTWYNSGCDSKMAVGAAVDAVTRDNADVIIGPPCSTAMKSVAELASHWNLPVIGWASSDVLLNDKSYYSTLMRMFGPVDTLGIIFSSLFEMFNWKICSVVVDNTDSNREIWNVLNLNFKKAEIHVVDVYNVNVAETKERIDDIMKQITREARIVLMAIQKTEIRKYMLSAYDNGMTSGDYVFMTLQQVFDAEWLLGNESWIGTDGRDKEARHAMETLFHVDIYSVYLYDTFYMYALLANKTITEGGDIRNGTLLLDKSRNYEMDGLTGHIHMDSSGDRLPEVEVLDLNADGYMVQLGSYSWDITNGSAILVWTDRNIEPRWAEGIVGMDIVPLATPICGFDGALCANALPLEAIILATLGGVILIGLIFVALFVYRKRKQMEQLESKLWRVVYDDIDLYTVNRTRTSRSQMSGFDDMSVTSKTEGRQLFATTAIYKGVLVAVRPVRKEHITITPLLQAQMAKMRQVTHSNLNSFLGACVTSPNNCALWQYCSKGSLQDVLHDEAIKLDKQFKISFVADIAKGMDYLHKTPIHSHGRLKSSNVVIDSRWCCKITDYGIHTLFDGEQPKFDVGEHASQSELYWTSPELLRQEVIPRCGTQKGDVYSFGIMFKEILCRTEPYEEFDDLTPGEIINNVKSPKDGALFRPQVESWVEESDKDIKEGPSKLSLMQDCWAENPDERPTFHTILKIIHKLKGKTSTNILDNMLRMLEKYADQLEDLVAERTEQLEEEKKRADRLLYRMLPKSVADNLKQGQSVSAEWFDDVSIYFSDIVSFTVLAAKSTPLQIVELLNGLYTLFDDVITRHDVYKVETIGDAYMVASGLPERNGGRHVTEIANCSLDLLRAVALSFTVPHLPGEKLQIRIGLHTGPCATGVVGLAMPRYCLFGDTVNTASRMESNGEAMKIHISESTYEALTMLGNYRTESRGEILIKGKGTMNTYWLLEKYDTPVHSKISNTPVITSKDMQKLTPVEKESDKDSGLEHDHAREPTPPSLMEVGEAQNGDKVPLKKNAWGEAV